MRRCVFGFDLGDAGPKRFVVRSRLGELTVYCQRQLLVALLEIELRHGLVDKRLPAGAGESLL
jgi:hypothetical protein